MNHVEGSKKNKKNGIIEEPKQRLLLEVTLFILKGKEKAYKFGL